MRVEYRIQAVKVGQCQVPGPEVYWMSHWDTWETLYFYMILVQAKDVVAVINTGPPQDLTALNQFWFQFAGERGILRRGEEERPQKALRNKGVDPDAVQYVFVTPLQIYATANVPLFSEAKICISQRGWIEDFHVPVRKLHVPRHFVIPDDVVEYLCIKRPDQLLLLPDEMTEVLPGIRTFWAGGHHRSSMVILVDTARGTVAIGDCFFKYENLEQDHPIGITESVHECDRAYNRIRSSASHFIPLYDPHVLERYPGGIIA